MKNTAKTIIIILLTCFSILANASQKGTNPITMYDNILNAVKLNSPYANRINFQQLRARGHHFLQGKKALCSATLAAHKFIIPALQQYDKHTSITLNGLGGKACPLPKSLPKENKWQWWSSQPKDLRKRIIHYTSHYHGKALDKIAYIYVPGGFAWQQTQINQLISQGRRAMKLAGAQKSCGAIVDLRFNTGGNNVPMILSLSSILPTQVLFKLGQHMPIKLENSRNMLQQFIPDGDKGKWQTYGKYTGNISLSTNHQPIAILINSFTASSGIMTALALTNVKPHRIFGEPSDSSNSVTQSITLPDGNHINIMVLRVYNSDGHIAPLSLSVNQKSSEKRTDYFDFERDQTILAAQQWLLKQNHCH